MSTKEVVFGFLILTVFIVLIFSGLWALYIYSVEYLLILLGIITGVGIVLLIRSYYLSKISASIDMNEYERLLMKTTHPLFYHVIMKTVTIKNADGDATIDYMMDCKNTSSECLSKIKHEIDHDGSIESLKATVNKQDFTKKLVLENFHTLKVLSDGKEIDRKRPFTLKMVFDVASMEIAPKADFRYGYTFTCQKLFPKLPIKGEESTSVFINHPTALLIISVELPDTMSLVTEGTHVEIYSKHEVEDFNEEKRCSVKYPVRVSNHKRKILWEVENPKIASYYTLYVQAVSEPGASMQKA
jgi:hypothetical protein